MCRMEHTEASDNVIKNSAAAVELIEEEASARVVLGSNALAEWHAHTRLVVEHMADATREVTALDEETAKLEFLHEFHAMHYRTAMVDLLDGETSARSALWRAELSSWHVFERIAVEQESETTFIITAMDEGGTRCELLMDYSVYFICSDEVGGRQLVLEQETLARQR